MLKMDRENIDKRDYIASLSTRQLLRLWRFGHSNNELLQGENSDFMAKELSGRRQSKPEEFIAISKELGWRG
jgi:hypothetical protein